MDWQTLRSGYPPSQGQPPRCDRLLALQRVLDGTQYDALPNDFATEYSGAGEYIPLGKRRPAVRTNLCRTVVDDSVSLLFGDTHWPTIVAQSPDAALTLTRFCAEASIECAMVDAATRGSVGSVALLVEIADRAPRATVLETAFLTPEWDDATGALVSVRERFQVRGDALAARGYAIPDDMRQARYWWQRTWTADDCEVLEPQPVGEARPARRDEARSLRHGLGFVPIIWIRNLGGRRGEPDGECTFERAIDTVIEADYLLSQAGRGLKYSADPTLVLKAGSDDSGQPVGRIGGAASALNLPPAGDAKLLEINGTAAGAVLDHYRELRALVLEQVHGNRAHADKLAAGQSGRAMEMMCLPLVWLADRLRQSYGNGLLDLLRMICAMSGVVPGGLRIGGEDHRDIDAAGLALHWPTWFEPTEPELLALAQALATAVDGGLLSSETACSVYAGRLGLPNAGEEWARVQAEIAGQPSPDTVRQDVAAGKTLTREATA